MAFIGEYEITPEIKHMFAEEIINSSKDGFVDEGEFQDAMKKYFYIGNIDISEEIRYESEHK